MVIFGEKPHPAMRKPNNIKSAPLRLRLRWATWAWGHGALKILQNNHMADRLFPEKYLKYTSQWQTCIEMYSIQSCYFPSMVLAPQVLSSGHVKTTRNLIRAAFLASHQHWAFQRGQKMFSLYTFSPGPGRGKTWTYFPCIELVNSLWTSGPAKGSFRLDPNGFTVPITSMRVKNRFWV